MSDQVPIDETAHKGDEVPDPANGSEHSIDINTMRQYLLVGEDAAGKPVSILSPNMSITDLGGYIGRLQAMLAVQVSAAGMQQFMARQQRGKVITPGGFRST